MISSEISYPQNNEGFPCKNVATIDLLIWFIRIWLGKAK